MSGKNGRQTIERKAYRNKWQDQLEKDLRIMGVRKESAQDRKRRRNIVKEAKAHKGL